MRRGWVDRGENREIRIKMTGTHEGVKDRLTRGR